jgi:exopolysaccharide biosynthesis polyprenyl glycosylphosphotransferase
MKPIPGANLPSSIAPDAQTKPQTNDIRAPRRLSGQWLRSWQGRRSLLLLTADLVALFLAGRIASYLNQFYQPLPPALVLGEWLGLPGIYGLLMIAVLVLFVRNGLYTASSQWQNYGRSIRLISLVYLGSLVLLYFSDPKLAPPRSLFLTAWLGSISLVVGFRFSLSLALRRIDQAQTKIFLLATAERLAGLAQALQQRSRYQIVGAALVATSSTSATLQAILASGAQEVLAESLPQTELASRLYWQLQRSGISLRLIPTSVEMLHHRGTPEVIAGLPTLRMEATLLGGWDYRLKRWLDFLSAALGLILLSPLFLGIAIAIKLDSPGAVFFRQPRMGLHGHIFQMWKFRTMVVNAAALQAALESDNQAKNGILFKIKHDPRVTSIGHLLRRTSLDELPQLWNVLLGQMSLVGPRPLPLRDVERFDPWHHTRHQVLPGITGLWQISGRSELDDFDDAARLDLYYIDHWSLNLDLEILLETFRIVLFGKGAY